MIRDRIKEFRRVPARELTAHPKNWRTHPATQRDALRGVLDDIGLADAVIARELADGSLQLVDGHLRAEVADDTLLPVLIVDLDDDETDKLLLAHDAITNLADVDHDNLADLVLNVDTNNVALQSLFEDLAQSIPTLPLPVTSREPPEVNIPQLWEVVAECADELQQLTVYQQLVNSGIKCRLITL